MLFSYTPKHGYIIGVLNITPDSFSDGGIYYNSEAEAVAHALHMIKDGADIIDLGGESSRPGAEPVSEAEEIRRVVPIIKKLREVTDIPLSIDTYKPRVAAESLAAGATIINDITGLQNPEMIALAAKYRAPVILMHMQGKPQTMQENPTYADVVTDVKNFFVDRIADARASGIQDIILDPGIGFGKTLAHNLTILKHLSDFTSLGYPVLVGPSRKSFIGKLTGAQVDQRLPGTLSSVVLARAAGASLFRVHDVEETKQALTVTDAILTA